MFFFVRFFDIYDSSLKGAPIDIYMKDLERKQRVQRKSILIYLIKNLLG